MNLSASNLMGGLLFGVIGFAAWRYGKKAQEWRPMLIGFLLMVFPYFVDEIGWLYGIGICLTVGLFVFRGE